MHDSASSIWRVLNGMVKKYKETVMEDHRMLVELYEKSGEPMHSRMLEVTADSYGCTSVERMIFPVGSEFTNSLPFSAIRPITWST